MFSDVNAPKLENCTEESEKEQSARERVLLDIFGKETSVLVNPDSLSDSYEIGEFPPKFSLLMRGGDKFASALTEKVKLEGQSFELRLDLTGKVEEIRIPTNAPRPGCTTVIKFGGEYRTFRIEDENGKTIANGRGMTPRETYLQEWAAYADDRRQMVWQGQRANVQGTVGSAGSEE